MSMLSTGAFLNSLKFDHAKTPGYYDLWQLRCCHSYHWSECLWGALHRGDVLGVYGARRAVTRDHRHTLERTRKVKAMVDLHRQRLASLWDHGVSCNVGTIRDDVTPSFMSQQLSLTSSSKSLLHHLDIQLFTTNMVDHHDDYTLNKGSDIQLI